MEKLFSYHLSLNDRLEQLVNNDYTADVFFKVGEAEELMFAHKTIITTASEVFFTQLNGQFEDAKVNSRENPIIIKDVQSSVFLQMLRFMYCEKVDLDCAMLVELYYAAKKYMLVRLVETCEEFIRDKEDVLKVFNDNRRYEFDNINRICLHTICDNPLKYFGNSFYTELDKKSLVMIIKCKKINCHKTQLLEAIQKWLKSNESQSEESLDLNQNIRELHCKKLYAYSQFSYSPNVDTSISMETKNILNLYGIGIFIGTEPTDATSIKLKVRILHIKTDTNCISEMKIVPLKDELYIYEIMFKKIRMEKGGIYRVIVEMEANEQKMPSMFYLKRFLPVKPDHQKLVEFTHVYAHPDYQKNCIAYLLYNDNESILKLFNEIIITEPLKE